MLPPSLRKNKPSKFNKENFFEKVFAVVKKIPRGRVTNYGAIANYLGTGLSARTVGWAMNSSHILVPPIPAHRVVNRNGLLTGKNHFATPTLMEELLAAEGVEVVYDKIQNFEKLFWNPADGTSQTLNRYKMIGKKKKMK